jgi:hypothetical protein
MRILWALVVAAVLDLVLHPEQRGQYGAQGPNPSPVSPVASATEQFEQEESEACSPCELGDPASWAFALRCRR